MLSHDALGLDSVMLDEARAYLRIEADAEDTSLGAILTAAISHAENFTGQMLIRRNARQVISAGSGWRRLAVTPVIEVISATGIPADGATFLLPDNAWQAEIDRNDDAYIRIRRPGAAGRVEVTVEAGLAEDWDGLPEALRLAILRLTGHLYTSRDDAQDAGPPAAVAALLRPWRRMRLSDGAKR
ncbi:MAG: phage head-tail connector protein [Sphingorhabdus sp.]